MYEVSLDAYHAGRHYRTLFLPLLLGRANVWQTLGQRSADALLDAFKPRPKQTGARSPLARTRAPEMLRKCERPRALSCYL